MGYYSSPPLYDDLEEDKRNTGYASQESFRHKIIFKSEDKDGTLINPVSPVSSAIVGKGNDQSST